MMKLLENVLVDTDLNKYFIPFESDYGKRNALIFNQVRRQFLYLLFRKKGFIT